MWILAWKGRGRALRALDTYIAVIRYLNFEDCFGLCQNWTGLLIAYKCIARSATPTLSPPNDTLQLHLRADLPSTLQFHRSPTHATWLLILHRCLFLNAAGSTPKRHPYQVKGRGIQWSESSGLRELPSPHRSRWFLSPLSRPHSNTN
jgi:hypothetical protein